MYRTFIFDLDGTLLNTLDDLTDSVNYTLENFGLPTRTKDEIRSFVGNGIRTLLTKATNGDGRIDEILTCFRARYDAHCKDKTKPYDGVLALLQALKSKGIKTAVVSNKADFAVQKLAKDYFGELLQLAVGENEAAGVRRKPAPDSLLSVMQKLGATAGETVYIGDSEVDIQTAKNAGVDCISVVWGFKDESFLRANGATNLVKTPTEILEFCKE